MKGMVVMPRKPKKPCAYPGCPELTYDRYCEKHAKEIAKQYESYGRDKSAKRKYNRAWKRIRDRYIASHPLCEMCLAEGRVSQAEEVHHKLPLSEGGTHEDSNLQALCKSCHSRLHAKRGDRWNKEKEYKF